jgi:hypothetical protein
LTPFGFMNWRRERGDLHLRGHIGLSDEIVKGMAERNVESGISGEVVRTGRSLIFEDVVNDPSYRELTSAGKVVSLGVSGRRCISNHGQREHCRYSTGCQSGYASILSR